MRSTIDFSFNKRSLNEFSTRCDIAISKLGNGSRRALQAALNEISEDSLAQVPRDTETLASSQYYEITGNYRTGFTGIIGYAGPYDPINPKTGKPASSYVLAVHEDLSANHPIGKAKFLEDPVRDYAARKFPRTVFKYAQESLADMSD